jgi:ADP-ribosylglycohydrolase
MLLLNTLYGGLQNEFESSVSFSNVKDLGDIAIIMSTIDSLLKINLDDKLFYSQIYDIFKNDYQVYGKKYLDKGCVFGSNFIKWLDNQEPYNSFSNGALLRAIPVGWFAKSIDELQKLILCSCMSTHNHPEAIKGAYELANAIYLLRQSKSKWYVLQNCHYDVSNTLINEVLDTTCECTIRMAFQCLKNSTGINFALKQIANISFDRDTYGLVIMSLMEACYGEDLKLNNIAQEMMNKIQPDFLILLKEFEECCIIRG